MNEPTETGQADLLVFSDDWGRHPSSCQHLVSHLLRDHRVLWVNTVGTRRPSFDVYSLARATGKLRSWWSHRRQAPVEQESNPRVIDPLMWPSFRSATERKLNRALLSRAVRGALGGRGVPVAVTTVPVVADLVGAVEAREWVYYCVDDLSAWPGLDGETLSRMERSLLDRVDRVVVVSEYLRERIRSLGRSSELLTHGVDLRHWQSSPEPTALGAFESHERPWIVFWGVVDRRLDVNFLADLSEKLDRGTILLVGPDNEPDPALDQLPRVRRVGPLPYRDLPALARSMSCAIMPYRDADVTRAMQPLKLKEYLATGVPVVVRRLPATLDWGDSCDLVDTPEEFTRAVLERLESGLPEAQRAARSRRLSSEDWSAKARLFERQIFGDANA